MDTEIMHRELIPQGDKRSEPDILEEKDLVR